MDMHTQIIFDTHGSCNYCCLTLKISTTANFDAFEMSVQMT